MKMFYLINSRIPTEKAEGLEAMKLCEAFSSKLDLVFVVSKRFNKLKNDPFKFYNIKECFKVVRLFVIDLIPLNIGRIGFIIEATSFALTSAIYVLFNSKSDDVFFSHDHFSLFFISFFRRNVFYDMHDFTPKKTWLRKIFFNNVKGIITTNTWKKNQLHKMFKISPDKIFSYPNGVDIKDFDIDISKKDARSKLKLPVDKTLVGYVGMLRTMDMDKGIDIALHSIKELEKDVILILVGGNEEDIKYYQDLAVKLSIQDRVLFVGWVKHEDIPVYLKAFDVLIAPFPQNNHYEYYMCPMKVFEYLASQRPIVVSDLVSIREILNENNSVLVKPDNSNDLATGISQVINDPTMMERIANQGYIDIKKFTWDNRVKNIICFINYQIN